jgi:hypothetical protein
MDGVTYWFRHTAEPRAVPLGRRFASNVLRDWGLEHMCEPVTLIASELLTNAVEATGTTKAAPSRDERETLPLVAVRLRVSSRALTVEVWDTSQALPRMRTSDADAENGRGLPIVTLLCKRWGSYRHPSGGKVVHAVLPLALPPVALTETPAEPSSGAGGRIGAGGIAEPDPQTVRGAEGPARRRAADPP